MSYTAPDYVDTKSQAILALASVIADEDKTALGDGSVNKALDVLADVLAESDVQVPQTNAGAILALAQYASGMVKPEGTVTITENGENIDVAQYAKANVNVSGGGGVDVGNVLNLARLDTTPVVGEELDDDIVLISSVSIADSVICASINGQALSVAAGCTVNTTPAFATASPSAYIVAFDVDYIITSVTEFAGTIAVSGEAGAYKYTFVVPEVEGDNVVLAIVASIA